MMGEPVRIQLSRKKGFRLQEHSKALNGLSAVSVARPHKWGNPFHSGVQVWDDESGRLAYVDSNKKAVCFFTNMLTHSPRQYPHDNEIKSELAGKNLACWCSPNDPCHADVLLEIANPQRKER